MNETEIVRKLAIASRCEAIPPVDVERRVLGELMVQQDDSWSPLVWVAGFASVAALPVGALAFYVLEGWTDPMLNVFFAFRWVML
jgi:hypothetical protein